MVEPSDTPGIPHEKQRRILKGCQPVGPLFAPATGVPAEGGISEAITAPALPIGAPELPPLSSEMRPSIETRPQPSQERFPRRTLRSHP